MMVKYNKIVFFFSIKTRVTWGHLDTNNDAFIDNIKKENGVPDKYNTWE